MIRIKKLTVGILEANCYIVYDDTKEAAIIDPGGNAQKIISAINEAGVNPKKILLTHGHFDHIAAAKELADEYGIKVYIHGLDVEIVNHPEIYFGRNMRYERPEMDGESILKDGDVITVGNMEFKVMHTPGHSEGSVVYFCEDAAFTGDTLFCGSIGRTDFVRGSASDMMLSLEKLSKISEDYKVYPGHGEETTLFFEKENNYYMSEAGKIR